MLSSKEFSSERDPMINSNTILNENKKLWPLYEENIINKNKTDINITKTKKIKLRWNSFIGSMSDIEKFYQDEKFLKNFQYLKYLLILIDSILRGIGQVMFANNPLSGLIIIIGLFIGNIQLTIYGIIGTTISTLTAHLLSFNHNLIRSGLYGFNGCLTAMAISYFSFSKSFEIIPFIIIMCIFSTIFYEAISKIIFIHFSIPSFTYSFQISSWIILLGALKYEYFYINGNILQPTLLTTIMNKSQISNLTFPYYSIQNHFIGFFTSISQVFFIDNPYTGIIILFGIGICSRMLAFFALFGAITGQLTAAYLLRISENDIYHGLWGYNSALTCQALGGMFLVLYGYKIWLVIFYGSIITVIIQSTVSSLLSPFGMPTFTFPFTLVCWIFCLIAPTKNIIRVKLADCNIPEDHYYRYRLSKYIQNEFKYLNLFNLLSSSPYEDITYDELSKIEKEFVPILMCTYAFKNDLKKMKILFKKVNHIIWNDFNNRTPIHISASQGYMNITEWLIEKVKININLIDNFGSTPLFDGFINGNFNLVNYLYLHGGIFPLTKTKELAFYLNAFIYENNIQGIKYLIKFGFNPNETDYDGRYSLHIAVNTNNFSIIRYLIEQTNIRLNIKDNFNQTPYDYALKLPKSDIANYLLEKKTNKTFIKTDSIEQINFYNKNNILSKNLEENLLPYLLSISTIDKLSNFINQHPNINVFDCIDYDKRCLSHLAAIHGHLNIIEYLYKHFPQYYFQDTIYREDRWNLSTLDYAFIYQHDHIINYVKERLSSTEYEQDDSNQNDQIIFILNKWKKIFLFLTLSASGNAQRIDTLYNRGYFIKDELYADYDGRTPMHIAAAYGQINVIQLLIHLKYKGIKNKDRWGYTPLDIAKQVNLDYVVILLQQQKL